MGQRKYIDRKNRGINQRIVKAFMLVLLLALIGGSVSVCVHAAKSEPTVVPTLTPKASVSVTPRPKGDVSVSEKSLEDISVAEDADEAADSESGEVNVGDDKAAGDGVAVNDAADGDETSVTAESAVSDKAGDEGAAESVTAGNNSQAAIWIVLGVAVAAVIMVVRKWMKRVK